MKTQLSIHSTTSQSFPHVGEKIQKVPKRRLMKPSNLVLQPIDDKSPTSPHTPKVSPLSNHYFTTSSPKSPLKRFIVIESSTALNDKLLKLSEMISSSTPVQDLFFHIYDEIPSQNRSLFFSKLLKTFKGRQDHAKTAFIFDCLQTKHQELNDYFGFTKEGRVFKPQGLHFLIDYFKTKEIMAPTFSCIVCPDCEAFETELQKLEEAPLNSKFGFIIRCQNSESEAIAHMTAIYLQRTSQGWKALQLDAAGHSSATLPMLTLKSKLQVRFFQGGEKRQHNKISCAVYALYDLAKLSFEEHLFDNLEKSLKQENDDENCIQLSPSDLPLDLIKVTEQVRRMKSIVKTKFSSSSTQNEEVTVFFDSIKKYLTIENSHQVNDFIRTLHCKYERYITKKLLESSSVIRDSNPQSRI